MTSKLATTLIIAAMLAGSAATSVVVAASVKSASVPADFSLRVGSVSLDGAVVFPAPTGHRFTTDSNGLKHTAIGVVRIAP